MRRFWSGFAPTQHNFHYTCNQVLHKAFWGTQVSFFFFGGKKPMHHYRDIDHTIVVLHFADHLPMFLNTLNSENMSWHHTRQCIESAAPQQFFFCTWAGPSAKWPTRLITLRSRLVRCFHLASFRVRFLIRALPSIPLFIISFPPTHLLSVNLFPFQDIARVHPGRAQWFGKFFLLLSLDWFFAQAMCKISMSLVW